MCLWSVTCAKRASVDDTQMRACGQASMPCMHARRHTWKGCIGASTYCACTAGESGGACFTAHGMHGAHTCRTRTGGNLSIRVSLVACASVAPMSRNQASVRLRALRREHLTSAPQCIRVQGAQGLAPVYTRTSAYRSRPRSAMLRPCSGNVLRRVFCRSHSGTCCHQSFVQVQTALKVILIQPRHVLGQFCFRACQPQVLSQVEEEETSSDLGRWRGSDSIARRRRPRVYR